MTNNDDRNFRYGYYEKVGFDGIEEKKSLEILLRENPSDLLSRLAQLASRYSLSPGQRKQIWQLLLNIIKPDNRINEIRCKLWRNIVQDLINAINIIGFTNNKEIIENNKKLTSKDYSNMIVLLFLFESKQLSSSMNVVKQFQRMEIRDLLSISEVFAKEFVYPSNTPSPSYHFEDAYWIYKHFITIINSNLGTLIETYEKFINHLSNEDNILHEHLVKNGIIKQIDNNGNLLYYHNNLINANNNHQQYFNNNNNNNSMHNQQQQNYHYKINPMIHARQTMQLQRKKLQTFRPIITWFIRFFAGIIHQNFVIRVLDKVIGCLINGPRPFYVLISISKSLIYYQRKQLLLLNNYEHLQNQLLTPLSLEESEIIFFRSTQ